MSADSQRPWFRILNQWRKRLNISLSTNLKHKCSPRIAAKVLIKETSLLRTDLQDFNIRANRVHFNNSPSSRQA